MKKRILSLFSCVVLVFSCLITPVYAADVPVQVDLDVTEFFDWVLESVHGGSKYLTGCFDHDVCKYAPGTSPRHNFVPKHTSIGGKTGTFYVCEYCGKSAGEVAAPAYQEQVSQLPATNIDSNGLSDCYITGWTYKTKYDSIISASLPDYPCVDSYCPTSHRTFIQATSSYFSVTRTGEYQIIFPKPEVTDFSDYSDRGRAWLYGGSFGNGTFIGNPDDGFTYTAVLAAGERYYIISYLASNSSPPVSGGLCSYRIYRPYVKGIRAQLTDDIPAEFDITTRPTSITGGNYGIVGDDGTINTVTNNNQIINETNNTYYNPATDKTSNISDWSYNYEDRSYTLTLENGDTSTVTYGDENISITENNVVEGSTTVNNYTIYYMVDKPADPDPTPSPSTDPAPSVSVCAHTWTETNRTDPTCVSPGSVSSTCSQCGETKTETLKAKGHTWQVERTVQTSYDEQGNLVQQGYTIYQCTVCGEQYKDDQGTGPPDSPAQGDEEESIWDKIGNVLGAIIDGLGSIINAILGKLLDWLSDLAALLTEKLGAVVDMVLALFDEIPKLFGGFLDFLGVVFPYLPSELTLLLSFGVVAVVFIGIIKALRR